MDYQVPGNGYNMHIASFYEYLLNLKCSLSCYIVASSQDLYIFLNLPPKHFLLEVVILRWTHWLNIKRLSYLLIWCFS